MKPITLTPLQAETLREFQSCLTFKEIAARHGLSRSGVRARLETLCRKFNVQNREDLLTVATGQNGQLRRRLPFAYDAGVIEKLKIEFRAELEALRAEVRQLKDGK